MRPGRTSDNSKSVKKKAAQSKEHLFHDFLSAYQARDDETAWQAFSQSRGRTGSFIAERLLNDYLDLVTKGQEDEARENLQALSYAGEIEAQRVGDHFTSDLARFYRFIKPSEKLVLMEARRLVKLGLEKYDQAKLEEAVEHYNRAKETFGQAGDVCETKYTDYLIGQCYLLQSKLKISLTVFEGLARSCEQAQYKWLLAQALYMIAGLNTTLNDYSASIETGNRFLKISEQIGDTNSVAKALQHLAQVYRRLNNYDRSLSLNQQSLVLGSAYSLDPMQKWRDYLFIAISLNTLGFYDAAIEYEKEALRLAIEIGRPQVICRSYINLGLMYGDKQFYAEAARNIQLAFQTGESISSDSAKMDILAYSSLQLGHLYRRSGEFGKAIASYDRAIEFYAELNNPAFSYVAHKGRLLSCIRQGACPSIEEELGMTLNLFEQYRSKILEESNRNSFFDTEQDIYDVAIDFEHSKNDDPQTAFDYSEKSRARSLLDLTSAGPEFLDGDEVRLAKVYEPKKLAIILERLPEQAQILQYAVLDDKLIVWVISRTGISSHKQKISLKELSDKVKDYLRILSCISESDEEQATSAAKSLYDILVAPIEPSLDENKQLCIVPDKFLNYLPYGALISPTSGKYLVEKYTIISSPSTNMFIVSSEAARNKQPKRPETLLSVGNPSFDHEAFPSFADLPSARREAEAITAYYNSSHLIIGDKATKLRVEKEMEISDVAHLALHSIPDEQFPERSKMLLAKEPLGKKLRQEPEGVLHSNEIYKLKLPMTRLVVLSACRTGTGRYYNGEGVIDIARSFIVAGVPLVIASLWSVDSDSTAELMISFHKHRKTDPENLSTAEALRRAQLDMLNSAEARYRRPYYWASFIAIGGYASF